MDKKSYGYCWDGNHMEISTVSPKTMERMERYFASATIFAIFYCSTCVGLVAI